MTANVDWKAVAAALEELIATGRRCPSIAIAAKADPARYATLSAEAIAPHKAARAKAAEDAKQKGEEEARKREADAERRAKAQNAKLEAMIDQRIAEHGTPPRQIGPKRP